MIDSLNVLFNRFLILVSFGAILVVVSEFWFYRVDEEVDTHLILLAYGFLGYFFLIVMKRFRVQSFDSFFITACMLGFLVEGVLVPVVYSGLPFTLVWTSMAWHALLSVYVVWYVFRQVMVHSSVFKVCLFHIAVGVFLGLWNSYMWNAREVVGSSEVLFEWQPIMPFIVQFSMAYVLFVVGHIIFERVYRTSPEFSKVEYYSLIGLFSVSAVLVAVASGLLVFFPALPLAVALCFWALCRAKSDYDPVDPCFCN